jgi:hypothetical protein
MITINSMSIFSHGSRVKEAAQLSPRPVTLQNFINIRVLGWVTAANRCFAAQKALRCERRLRHNLTRRHQVILNLPAAPLKNTALCAAKPTSPLLVPEALRLSYFCQVRLLLWPSDTGFVWAPLPENVVVAYQQGYLLITLCIDLCDHWKGPKNQYLRPGEHRHRSCRDARGIS